jgi:hypothetical protein
MKKSLVKYIISSQKDNVQFENRLSEIFSRSLDSETSLETLVYGIPKTVNVLDITELKNRIEIRYSNGCVRCIKINEVEIDSSFKIVVRYEHSYRRYFSSEEQRDDAIKNGRKYDGVSDKDSAHPYEGWINNLSDAIRFDIDELEGIVEVVRE